MALALVVLALLGAATVAVGDDCRSQPVVGLCLALIPRYFYNVQSRQCEIFYYGGCGGNENNYETLEECEQSCVHLSLEDCSAAPETGMCRAAFPRLYFDVETGRCEEFIYGGCGGNKNNFGDEQECSDKCGKYVTAADPEPEPETEEKDLLCSTEPEVGPCRAAVPRYFWNHRLGVCQPFTYGGCQGNGNNFASSEQCHQTCQGTPVKVAECGVQPESGMCMAYFPSYFYNATSGECENFIYGGCAGNGNRFETLTACHATCGQAIPLVDEGPAISVCAQPVVTGPCRAYIPRYAYDSRTGSCQKFYYGGCGGNGNNFEKLEDCHNTCVA